MGVWAGLDISSTLRNWGKRYDDTGSPSLDDDGNGSGAVAGGGGIGNLILAVSRYGRGSGLDLDGCYCVCYRIRAVVSRSSRRTGWMKGEDDMAQCAKCMGCGWVADTADQEPWSMWANLPPESAIAARIGLVQPIRCPQCEGSGKEQ